MNLRLGRQTVSVWAFVLGIEMSRTIGHFSPTDHSGVVYVLWTKQTKDKFGKCNTASPAVEQKQVKHN